MAAGKKEIKEFARKTGIDEGILQNLQSLGLLHEKGIRNYNIVERYYEAIKHNGNMSYKAFSDISHEFSISESMAQNIVYGFIKTQRQFRG